MTKYSELTAEQKEKERAKARERYWRDPDAARARSRAIPKDVQQQRSRANYRKIKAEVWAHYGNACSCCGETEPLFLCLEHLDGEGLKHRRSVGDSGLGVLLDIRRRGFPPEFTVRCFNCNQGRQLNGGICPHRE
jgi:hypothetical protein